MSTLNDENGEEGVEAYLTFFTDIKKQTEIDHK